MNYFAHGRRYIDNPYFLAGTAVPDWLNVVDRKVRARTKGARPQIDHDDPKIAAVARGIVQHHADDHQFHQTASFAQISLEFTMEFRQRLTSDDSFRPSFLGHIIVEILLDSVLILEDPEVLEQYYRAVLSVEAKTVERAVNLISVRPTDRLALLLPRFCQERFLEDYHCDETLLRRLNQVMRRVKLPALPETVLEYFPRARKIVTENRNQLLEGIDVGGN